MKTGILNRPFLLIQIILLVSAFQLNAQNPSWQLWAQGLQQGAYPHLEVAPNHDIFYSLVGTPPPLGVVYKANTQTSQGSFTTLPAIPLPASLANNVMCVIANAESEPIAGVYRNNTAEPWLFRLDKATNQWEPAHANGFPALGAFCAARAKNGTIWVGARWSYLYKSTDGGRNFVQIREDSSIAANYPCYYPTWNGSPYDGAIFSVNTDHNGRVYAGTETAGIVYSDDEGLSWRPADYHPCQDVNPMLKDSASAMKPLGMGGNAAAIGFTADNNLVWNGASMWSLGWPNTLGYADLTQQTASPLNGIPQYLVTTGQQVTRIVTASNGQMFLHSGGNGTVPGVGIYTSMDGLHWTPFNTGIAAFNDNQSQGSLVVDSNLVFFATHDGKVWRYVTPGAVSAQQTPEKNFLLKIAPNPASGAFKVSMNGSISGKCTFALFNLTGRQVFETVRELQGTERQEVSLEPGLLPAGVYSLKVTHGGASVAKKVVIMEENE